MELNFSHSFEICNSVCPLVRECGRSHIHFNSNKVLEYPVHSFKPKSGKCLSQIELSDYQEKDIQ